jgi:hypothetical protein
LIGAAVFGLVGPLTRRGKSRFNGVAGPYVLPMFDRKIVECQDILTVLFQKFGGLGVFCPIDIQEKVKRLLRLGPGLGHSDLVDMGFGSFLNPPLGG